MFKYMKHTIHKLSLLLSIIVLLCSCELREDEDHHFKIYFENHWTRSVYLWDDIDWHWYDNPFEEIFDKDWEETVCVTKRCREVPSGSVDDEFMKRDRDYYEDALEDGDSVVICVFDVEKAEEKDSACFFVRYHMSKEDLQKVHFRVSFPPTEEMKDFYMSPSYDEVVKYCKSQGRRIMGSF